MAGPREVPIVITWKMADEAGTAPLRAVAAHAEEVAAAWLGVSDAMVRMADGLDALVAGAGE